MALTTPPTALPPYSKAAGPRTTSICSMTSGSIVTAWSKLNDEASRTPTPFCIIRTRSASRPRITGREALGPKCVAATPGIPFRVSPKVLSRLSDSSRPLNIETGITSASEATPSGLPVTGIVGKSIFVVCSAQT